MSLQTEVESHLVRRGTAQGERPKGKRQVFKSLWPLEGGVSKAELRAGCFQKRGQEVASGVGPSPLLNIGF